MTCNEELEKWTRGQYVEVFGLQSQAGRQLNRQRGIVIKVNDATGRIEVCLGAEGKMASLKPECLRLVIGASAEELQDAKDVAGPALREAQEACGQPVDQVAPSADTSQPAERERSRSRSWSPPPEALRAASVAATQASSAAVARGLSSEQSEALGAAAAEQSLANAKQAAKLQSQAAGDQHAATHDASSTSGVSDPMGIASRGEKPRNSVEDLKVGDTVQAIGLKGADKELNGEDVVIQEFQGFGSGRNRRYVVSLTKLIIDDNGELAEQKRVLTLTAKNISLKGSDGKAVAESMDVSDDPEGSSKKPKKKTSSKRSRSRRRRRRRSPSRSDSTSSASPKRANAPFTAREPTPALTKADRLRKFGFLQQR